MCDWIDPKISLPQNEEEVLVASWERASGDVIGLQRLVMTFYEHDGQQWFVDHHGEAGDLGVNEALFWLRWPELPGV